MLVTTDYLIIGSGIAGGLLAMEMSSMGQVILICKDEPLETNTLYAQGGIAAVVDKSDDSFEMHYNDTLIAGDGLCDEKVVMDIISSAPYAVESLEKYGVEFDGKAGKYLLGREGAHQKNRILFHRDCTGREIQNQLYKSIKNNPNIILMHHCCAIDLIMEYKLSSMDSDAKRCWGAYVFDRKNGTVLSIGARKTILATGGAGKTYLYTSNPDTATGDGIAMAYRAGATVSGMEFMQFHPTTLYHPYAKNFLISEAVRGEGGILKDASGNTFMEKYHEMKSLAPRDIVARAIDTEMKLSGEDCVFLDITMRPSSFVKERFPNIHKKCLEYNIDITKEMIPVVPAAHYTCGGVNAEVNGRTDIENLYAVGETACTGFHGANRLASNSLLEGSVMALKAAEDLKRQDPAVKVPSLDIWESPTVEKHENVMVNNDWDELRRTMWNFVGIVRSDMRLRLAMRRVEMIQEEIREFYYKNPLSVNLLEMRNLIINSRLTVMASSWRKESRGIHYTLDYPEKDPAFASLRSQMNKREER